MKILISGPPGVGKSTILEKIRHLLTIKNQTVLGCIVKEKRRHEQRYAFDLHYFPDRHESLLASAEENLSSYYLSKYSVNMDVLEKELIPFIEKMSASTTADVLILDEIGRIQHCSPNFLPAVDTLILCKKNLLATIVHDDESWAIPYKRNPNIFLIPLTVENRAFIPELIEAMLSSSHYFHQLTPDQEAGVRHFFMTFMHEHKFLELKKLFKHTITYIVEERVKFLPQKNAYIVQGNSALRTVTWKESEGYGCTCAFHQGEMIGKNKAFIPRVCSHIQTVCILVQHKS